MRNWIRKTYSYLQTARKDGYKQRTWWPRDVKTSLLKCTPTLKWKTCCILTYLRLFAFVVRTCMKLLRF